MVELDTSMSFESVIKMRIRSKCKMFTSSEKCESETGSLEEEAKENLKRKQTDDESDAEATRQE